MSVKLNADIIFESLCRYIKAESYGKRKPDVLFGRPEFVTSHTQKLQSGHLYIALTDRLPGRALIERDVLIVCLGGKPPTAYLAEDIVCIVVQVHADLLNVSNYLTEIYNRHDAWDQKIFDIAGGSASVKELADSITPVFGSPVMILDRQFHYLSYSSCIDTRDELTDYRPSKYGNVVPEQLSGVLKSYGTQMSIQEPIYAALLHDMISVNLFDGEMPLGSITVVFIDHPRQTGDTVLLAFIARRVERLLKKHRLTQSGKKGVLEDIVQNLLSCYPVDANDWRKVDAADLEGTFQCMKVQIRKPSRRVPLDYIRNGFDLNLPGTIAVVYENAVVAVVNLATLPGDQNEMETYVQKLLDDVDLTAGVSLPYHDLALTRTYYRQAGIAIELSVGNPAAGNYHLFDRCALDYMLLQCSGEFSDEMLYCRGLDQVLRHDTISDTEYILTLRTFLDNSLNVTRTANQLHIHKTSLLARLKRIKSMLDVDLTDPDQRLQLMINLKKIK